MLRLLNRTLSSLESTVISLGGLIGAGLFVGSGTVIATVGRRVVASYLVAGVLLVAMLHLMARMRRRMPAALFITDFVHAGLGALGGSVASWIYWAFWAVVVTIEALAGANILVPDGGLEGLLAAIGLVVFTTGIGEKLSAWLSELEVGFASVKVVVIIAFIALALFHVVGRDAHLQPPSWRPGFDGSLGVLGGVVTTFFSLAGVEIVHTVAHSPRCSARESGRAIKLISIRVFGIYVVSIGLIVDVLSSNTIRPGFSPFTLTLEMLDHPRAARWLSALVLIGVLTTLNTALAIGTGLLDRVARDERLSGRGGAAKYARRISPRLFIAAIAIAVLSVAALWPSMAYAYLVKSASVLLATVYILFVLAADRLESCPTKTGSATRADANRCWVGRALAASLAAVLLAMAWIPASQGPLSSALCLVALVALFEVTARRRMARSA